MRIPRRLSEKLAQSPELLSGVLASITQFQPWITNSNLPFFPEYTNHGLEHLEDVLATSEALIRDQAWLSLTPADSAALVLAVLLHDVAMHLSEDAFIQLVSSDVFTVACNGYADRPWPELWSDYLSEARRWDGRKLKSLFGDSNLIKPPPLDAAEMTRRDRLLIGEFLRSHHHRLAHEIALNGVPGPESSRIQLREIPDWLADLSGAIARSHGMPLRDSLPYLQKGYRLREFRGVRSPFLMAVLRVADYLQVQAERAPQQVLQVARIRSPLSRREWDVHHSVVDIQNTHDDPEAVFIVAKPPCVSTFLKFKQWLVGIQAELDVSWAVIGEVYGRVQGLSGLGLEIRRIRSNVEDVLEFANQVDYLPEHARFDSAGAELLKILIVPLYGNRPSIGIRELLQNALDAVYERAEVARRRNLTQQESKDSLINIDLTTTMNHTWLTIRDPGIGMTSATVIGYFLRAGASFRKSGEWRESF